MENEDYVPVKITFTLVETECIIATSIKPGDDPDGPGIDDWDDGGTDTIDIEFP